MTKPTLLSTVLVVASLAGCVTRSEIEEIKNNQQKILAKLDQVGKGGAAPARPRPRRPDPAKVYSFPVADAPVKGPHDAWVTMIEVSDFQCPYCKKAAATVGELVKKYGDDLRVAFKHNPLPFHKRAKPAAVAAECAHAQGKFWPMHDVLFENNRKLEDDDLKAYAAKVGLNIGKFEACLKENPYDKKIAASQRQAARLGARGTPAFFINGRFLSGAQPAANFERLIDEELKKAKASGVSKGDYYEKQIVAKGQKKM